MVLNVVGSSPICHPKIGPYKLNTYEGFFIDGSRYLETEGQRNNLRDSIFKHII